jgi:integrase
MGTVQAIRGRDRNDGGMTPGGAVEAFLGTLDHPESQGTRRVYASTLRAVRAGRGDTTATAALDPRQVADWFTRQWGQAAPATWNRNLDAIRSAQRYWQDRGWMNAADLTSALRRRQRRADRSRALSRADVERLLTREDIAIRDRTLLTGRRARVQLPPCDIDPASGRARLSYRQAENLFKAASGGATLHQLRHSALTHDAEAGASTPMLMAKSGHTSVASLARYARPSAEALARWQERNDPARRR